MTYRCNLDDCETPVLALGLCPAHYHRWRRSPDGEISDKPVRKVHNSGTRGTCGVDGCGRPHKARGMCRNHYKSWKRRQATA